MFCCLVKLIFQKSHLLLLYDWVSVIEVVFVILLLLKIDDATILPITIFDIMYVFVAHIYILYSTCFYLCFVKSMHLKVESNMVSTAKDIKRSKKFVLLIIIYKNIN